jgi:enoyl-CoA hydratase
MSYHTITYRVAGGVATVTLNRPRANNAVSIPLAQELTDACSVINRDETIRVVIITGAGKVFSVGTTPSRRRSDSPAPRLLPAANALSHLHCPVIAAINGDAIGQGLELALAADIRIAAETARLGLPHIASGLIPWDGGTQRLPRLVGRARALEILLTGEMVTAAEAYCMGLVNKMVPLAELPSVVAGIAQKIAASAPLAARYAKEAVRQGMDLTLEQGLRLETDLYLLLQTTADRTEGITAFLEKRQPRFKGK